MSQPVSLVPDSLQPELTRLQSMRNRFHFFGLATAIYALFFTFCLYKNYSGITFPFFVSGTLYYFCLCMKKLSIPLKKNAYFYAISIVLLGIATFLTDDTRIIVMNYIAVLFYLSVFYFIIFMKMANGVFHGIVLHLLLQYLEA